MVVQQLKKEYSLCWGLMLQHHIHLDTQWLQGLEMLNALKICEMKC